MDTVNFTRQGPPAVEPKAPVSSAAAPANAPGFQAAKASEDKASAPSPSNLLPFTSPVIASDSTTGALVLSFRDENTGEALYQYPSKTALQYQTAQTRPTGVKPVGSDEVG